jgi:hypothetical protein
MVRMRVGCRAADPDPLRSSPLVWFALAAAAALLVSLAIAAAQSGGLDRLLPKDQPFAPYFTT